MYPTSWCGDQVDPPFRMVVSLKCTLFQNKDNFRHIEQFQSFYSISYIALNLFESYIGLNIILREQIEVNSYY